MDEESREPARRRVDEAAGTGAKLSPLAARLSTDAGFTGAVKPTANRNPDVAVLMLDAE